MKKTLKLIILLTSVTLGWSTYQVLNHQLINKPIEIDYYQRLGEKITFAESLLELTKPEPAKIVFKYQIYQAKQYHHPQASKQLLQAVIIDLDQAMLDYYRA